MTSRSYIQNSSLDPNSSDIESATPLGADLNSPLASPQHSEPPSFINYPTHSPLRDTISNSNSPHILQAPINGQTSPPLPIFARSTTINHQEQQLAVPRGSEAVIEAKKKRVTFGPTTIVLIPPRSALQSESQETLDSPPSGEDYGDDLLPFLSSNEHPPMAEDEDDFEPAGNVRSGHHNTPSLGGAQQQRMGISFSDAPPAVTILKRYVNPTPPPFGESSSSIAEEVDVVASWVESTPPCSLPSPHGSPSSAVAEVECVDVIHSDDEIEEDVFAKAPETNLQKPLLPSSTPSSSGPPQNSDNSQDKSQKQQTSLSKFGFSATASKTPSSAGQKRPRDKTQLRKKDSKQRNVQVGGGGNTTAFIDDSDSSEYEIEEPIQQSELGLVNGLLSTTNTSEEPSGPATTSFSQFELIGTIPREGAPTLASTAKAVVVPARLAWTDDASQDSLMEVASVTTKTPTNNTNAMKAKEANDSFWSKIRSITNTPIPESKKPPRETLKAILAGEAAARAVASSTLTNTVRDTSPVLFGRSNPSSAPTTTTTVKTDTDLRQGVKVEEDNKDDTLLGSPSSSLSALANSVVTPSTTPPAPAKEVARVGRALVCDLCGCAELKGSEGMIIAPIEVNNSASNTAPPPPEPYNSKVIPGFYVVHLLCALWSPEVYYEESGQDTNTTATTSSSSEQGHYCGIGACIRRARHIKCAHCRQPGASIGCVKATCQRSYHRQCAEDAGAALDCDDFQVACPHHKTMLPTTTPNQ